LNLAFSLLIGILSVVVIMPLVQISSAQNQTSPAEQVMNFTRLVEEQFTFDRLGLGFSLPDLEVLYESPETLVLRGEVDTFSSLGQVIDIAKQNGYNIDSTTVFTQSTPSAVTDGVTLTDTYTIFMSKE
jgi:hypothetical protein